MLRGVHFDVVVDVGHERLEVAGQEHGFRICACSRRRPALVTRRLRALGYVRTAAGPVTEFWRRPCRSTSPLPGGLRPSLAGRVLAAP